MSEEQKHIAEDLKSGIAAAAEEHRKIVDGREAYNAKKPDMFKEIQEKVHEKEEIQKGKEAYEAKKPQLFKEIQEATAKK